jgi:hypothetical protein
VLDPLRAWTAVAKAWLYQKSAEKKVLRLDEGSQSSFLA